MNSIEQRKKDIQFCSAKEPRNSIFALFDHLVWHYTTFNSFFSMMNSDELWLSNAKFCNDSEEIHLGQRILHLEASQYEERYVLSLCDECDKLSQWRGYAHTQGIVDGVSIGFDMRRAPLVYSILPANCKEKPERIVARPHKVVYTDQQIGISQAEAGQAVAFLKHPGFKEESEYRLCVHPSNKNGIQHKSSNGTPYIKLSLDLKVDKPCVVRLHLNAPDLVQDVQKAINDMFPDDSDKYPKVIDCFHGSFEKDSFCFDCTQTDSACEDPITDMHPCVGDVGRGLSFYCRENRITVSQGNNQSEVFAVVHKALERNGIDVPVWCDGHLPVREVTIGPVKNKQEWEDRLKHFFKHTQSYWLRDVRVKQSNVPYR